MANRTAMMTIIITDDTGTSTKRSWPAIGLNRLLEDLAATAIKNSAQKVRSVRISVTYSRKVR